MIPKVGPILAKNLLSYCGSPEEVFKASRTKLEKIPGIGDTLAPHIAKCKPFKEAEAELEYIMKNKIKVLCYTDDDYPTRMKHLPECPLLLFLKGDVNLNADKSLSLVGSRNATEYGRYVCEEIISKLAKENVLIVSGMAYGIDITAHKSALKHNLPTVGVVAHGLGTLYPAVHKSVADRMLKSGGLVSEYTSQTTPERDNFPARNRIIAALSDVVVVVESAKTGGALITSSFAAGYNRDVYSVPGRWGEMYSEGCNNLIRDGNARMFSGVDEMMKELGWGEKNKINSSSIQKQMFVDLSPNEQIVFDLVRSESILSFDVLSIRSELPTSLLAGALLKLEFEGMVKCLPGKIYQYVR